MAKTIKMRQAAEILGILSAFWMFTSCATAQNQAAQDQADQDCAAEQSQPGQASSAEPGKKQECVNRKVAAEKPTGQGQGEAPGTANLPLNPTGRPGSSVGWGRAY